MPFDLLLVTILRALVQVAGYALIGQGVLALLAGSRRDQNIFYVLLKTIASPAVKAVRFIAPRFIIDAHIPFLTFFILFWLLVVLTALKHHLCALYELAC